MKCFLSHRDSHIEPWQSGPRVPPPKHGNFLLLCQKTEISVFHVSGKSDFSGNEVLWTFKSWIKILWGLELM